MTPENAPAMEPQPAGMSQFSRLTGVFFEPAKTFADIAQRPRWLVPLLLIILFGLCFWFVLGQQVGWDQVANQEKLFSPKATQMQEQRMQGMSDAQRQQAEALQAKIVPFTHYARPLFLPVGYLIWAGVLLGVTAIMSAGVKFKQVFAIICYAGLTGIVQDVLKIVVVFLKKQDVNVMNPLAFNPAAFMDPMTSPKFMYTLGMGLDLFAIWFAVLVTIGLKAAAGRRLSYGGAAVAVFVPWAILALVGAAIAGAFA